MAYTYKHLTEETKTAMANDRKPKTVKVDDATIAAWEADHYAHSLNLAEANADTTVDAEVKSGRVKAATDAMAAIEAAITKAQKP